MRFLPPILISLLVFAAFYSCQKEIALTQQTNTNLAEGSLQSSGGDCLPKTLNGAYIVGKAMNDTNYIEVTVNVTTAGPYTIYTDTLNGYVFKASGTFTSTGSTTVRLKGSGTPAAAGDNNFTVTFGSSRCLVKVTVLSAGTGQAAYALSGTGGNCAPFTPSGNYIKDTSLDGRHFVTVTVNVTAVGTYSITTNTVNGYSFSSSGTFGTTGPQTVKLQGQGKPLAAGTNTFTVTAATSTCSFTLTVTAATTGGCNPNVQGNYTAGTAVSASNKVTLTHTYVAPGTFTISTNTINGYSFGPTTITATAGTPTAITLNATGTPAAAGTNAFTVDFGDGSGGCTFTVTVTPNAATGGVYIPLSLNSWWSYDVYASSSTVEPDSLLLTNRSTFAFGGKTYTRVSRHDNNLYNDTMSFASAGNDYYIHVNPLEGHFLICDSVLPKYLETIILKTVTTTGASWNSNLFTHYNSGMSFSDQFQTRVKSVNTTLTVRGKTYTNVITVDLIQQIKNQFSGVYTDYFIHSFSFAKDIGIVQYYGFFDGQWPFYVFKWELRNYKII